MEYSYYYSADPSGLFGFLIPFALVMAVIGIVAYWRLFEKAGEPGWASIIPFYNVYEIYKITWGSGWYFLLLLIPFANYVIIIITQVKLAKAFGKGGGFACGLIFLSPIFMLILAFGDARYVGPDGRGYNPNGYNPNMQGGYNPNNNYDPNMQNNGYGQNDGYTNGMQ